METDVTYRPDPEKNVFNIHICNLDYRQPLFSSFATTQTHKDIPTMTKHSSAVNQKIRLCVDNTVE